MKEISFCRAGDWAKRAITDFCEREGIDYELMYDCPSKCGTVRVADEVAQRVADEVIHHCELKDVMNG